MNRATMTHNNNVENDFSHSTGILQRKCSSCSSKTSAEDECLECANKNSILQRKLSIGASNDPLEHEADRVADKVLAMPTKSYIAGNSPLIQRVSTQSCRAELTTPPSVARAITDRGNLMRPALRQEMEQRFGHDFSHVRIHTGSAAVKSTRDVRARAYTIGHNVVFGAGQFEPGTNCGKRLLAHELTHVVQQESSPKRIQRKVASEWETIESNLSYGLFDWAIKDAEAEEVLSILSGLSEKDLADTVGAMDREGLTDRLLDNISDEDKERYAVLIGKINRYRSVSHTIARIMGRLETGFFDWAVTDQDATDALRALMGLDYHQLRTIVARLVNNGGFDKLLAELPTEEHKRFAAFIRRLYDIKQEFKTLVGQHLAFLRGQSDGAGQTMRNTTQRTGYGSSKSTWNDLPAYIKRDWRRRARVAIANVIESVRGTELEDIVSRSHFDFDPERAEKLNAYAYVTGSNTLQFGKSWVGDAESDPKNVWQSIAHELGGHEEFGGTWSREILSGTLRQMTPEERRIARSATNSLYSAYGYLETEIYAELRELPFRVANSGGDRPDSTDSKPGDVKKQLNRIKEAFGPDVGRQIVIRLYYRVMGDPRVSESARRLLYTEVQAVFGLFPLSEGVRP